VALKGDVMKSIGITGVVFAGALLLCSGGAQAADILVKADVPFAFVVNGQPMPAGKYLIQRDENSPSTLLIRGDQKNNSGAAIYVITIRDGRQDPAGDKPVMTFKHSENTYQLASIWDSQDDGFDVLSR
jgi:hypothetical protein